MASIHPTRQLYCHRLSLLMSGNVDQTKSMLSDASLPRHILAVQAHLRGTSEAQDFADTGPARVERGNVIIAGRGTGTLWVIVRGRDMWVINLTSLSRHMIEVHRGTMHTMSRRSGEMPTQQCVGQHSFSTVHY